VPDEILEIIVVNLNRTVSFSKFSYFQAFAFADQNLPGSDTFDLFIGPFSLSKVLSFKYIEKAHTVADLGEGGWPPLFWVKKKKKK